MMPALRRFSARRSDELPPAGRLLYRPIAKVFGCDPAEVDFMFCAIERKRPHGIGLYKAGADMIELGRKQYNRRSAPCPIA